MAEPFRRAPDRSALTRSLRSKRVGTIEAIEDMLAACTRLRDVTVTAVDAVCEVHGVELARRFGSDRRHLYRRYLAHCLEDRILTEEENADLAHLRALLHLSDDELDEVHDEVAREVYGKAIVEVLGDMEITPEETDFLRRLRGELHLSEAVAQDLMERGRWTARSAALREASTPDKQFTVHRQPAGEFTGRSDESFEAAVSDALAKAVVAFPVLHWFEVTNISGYVGDGQPRSWHVTVRGGVDPNEA